MSHLKTSSHTDCGWWSRQINYYYFGRYLFFAVPGVWLMMFQCLSPTAEWRVFPSAEVLHLLCAFICVPPQTAIAILLSFSDTWWKWQTSEAILLCALWQLALSLMVHRHHLLHYWSDNIHRILKIILKGWTKLSCTRVWRDQTIWMLLMNISWHWLVADRLLKIIYGTQAYTLHPPNWDIVKKTFLFCPCRNLWSVFIKIICDIQYIPHIMAL